MGTVRGIRGFTATVAAAGSIVAGGGAVYMRSGGETCVHILAGVAALSEPAYAALKADHMIIDGVIGWHYTYDPRTGQTTAMNRLYSKLMIVANRDKFGDLIEPNDLSDTTPSLFFVRGGPFDHQVVHWQDLRDAGYEIKSTSEALLSCGDAEKRSDNTPEHG